MEGRAISLYAKKRPVKLTETIFDITYLGTVLASGVLLCLSSGIGSLRWRFGLIALILGAGDAFHLIPRIHAMWDGKMRDHTAALGLGKLITSVTMTVFYLLLWNVGTEYFAGVVHVHMTAAVCILAALRIALCLLPQNRWMSESPPLKWAIWRNVPFFMLGMSVMALFAAGSRMTGGELPFLDSYSGKLRLLFACGAFCRENPQARNAYAPQKLRLCRDCADGIFTVRYVMTFMKLKNKQEVFNHGRTQEAYQ